MPADSQDTPPTAPTTASSRSRANILDALIERLTQSLATGPVMNARPHFSRQRLDLAELAALGLPDSGQLLRQLLTAGRIELQTQHLPPERPSTPFTQFAPGERDAVDRWRRQQAVMAKLRTITADAADYLGDHGESALAIGCPLLSLPPNRNRQGGSARVLAPLAFLPVEMQVRGAGKPRGSVTIRLAGEGAGRLVPNEVLLAFLERESQQPLPLDEVDDNAPDPLTEIHALTDLIRSAAQLPPEAAAEAWDGAFATVPRTEDLPATPALIHGAVLGLFPMHNSGLLRDMEWMREQLDRIEAPAALFLDPRALELGGESDAPTPDLAAKTNDATAAQEQARLIAPADPCQATAVWRARSSKALIIHGPPGTGKSQTITNVIADHLARGERVLFVSDKRTALDVVKHRLDALGIGQLCAVVHDAVADRLPLYQQLRRQLDALAETPLNASPSSDATVLESRWQTCREELAQIWSLLHAPDGERPAFHDMVAGWFTERSAAERIAGDLSNWPEGFDLPDLNAAQAALDELLRRAARIGYRSHPWRAWALAGPDALARIDLSRAAMTLRDAIPAASAADAHLPDVPASLRHAVLRPESIDAAAAALRDTAVEIGEVALGCDDEVRRRYAEADAATLRGYLEHAERLSNAAVGLADTPLDPVLFSSLGTAATLTEINRRLSAVKRWAGASGIGRWFRFLHASAARAAVEPLGLTLTDSDAARATSFYQALQLRLVLGRELGDSLGAMPADDALARNWQARKMLARLLSRFLPDAPLASFGDRVRGCLCDPLLVPPLVPELAAAAGRLSEGAAWMRAVVATGLLQADSGAALLRLILEGTELRQLTEDWLTSIETTPDISRIQELLAMLPNALRQSAAHAAIEGMDWQSARPVLTSIALSASLRQAMAADPRLSRMDGDRIESLFAELRQLAMQRRDAVRDGIQATWLMKQRERLLASTQSRLNSDGAAIRQRLLFRGARALRMRSMIAAGQELPEGDPLFDLCPIWMAAPSTVAQILPRLPLFDVVIFDEASQCRLEETLPALLRARRVVIAGDQQQLPPTRFFEASVTEAEDSATPSGDDLFEQRQSSAEDLLSAALNLAVDEAFLDVHYRSRHDALIAYSNEAFYQARLQTLPPPLHDGGGAPAICLHEVGGVYQERTNPAEARQVVDIVAQLLLQPSPPSIGIACFNITQRDVILDALDDRAAADPVFASALATARTRQSAATFEGLFVRNLENVQGDERDVMIISTTFGPDEEGVFRRHFGILNRPGGGRRLNVLVTRARQQVHIVTSIPRQEFAGLPPVPAGSQPGGRYHLYAYLAHASRVTNGEPHPDHASLEKRDAFAIGNAIARRLQTQLGHQVMTGWGSEGLALDAAFVRSDASAACSTGVLVDFARYSRSGDPVAWDLFRQDVLRATGWEIQRVWSPDVFRRPQAVIDGILKTPET